MRIMEQEEIKMAEETKNNIEKLEDIPMSKASELIGKIMKQRKAEKHD